MKKSREYRRRLRGWIAVRRATLIACGVVLGLTAALLAMALRPRAGRVDRNGCQTGPTTAGIDVSYYQQTIDWPRVRQAGIQFAFIRLSDGAGQRDAMFQTNWAEARRAGVVRGAYQYFRPDQDVTAQVDLMVAALRGRDASDLPPVIDIEDDGGLPIDQVAEHAAAWVGQIRARIGVEPIVYTGGDLWRAGGAEPLAGQPLWIAHYTQGCPVLPAPWKRWAFWQHTDRGAVPGIEGPVDLDRFAGTLGELHAAR